MNFSIWLILAWKSFKWSIYGAIETQCFSYGASRKYERAEFENRSPLIFGESASLAFPRIVLFPSFYCLWLPVHRFASERHGSRSSVYYYTWYSHVPGRHISSFSFCLPAALLASSRGLLKSRDRESTSKTLNFRPEADWLKVGLNQNQPTGFSEKIRRRNVRLRLRELRSCNALNLPCQTWLYRLSFVN